MSKQIYLSVLLSLSTLGVFSQQWTEPEWLVKNDSNYTVKGIGNDFDIIADNNDHLIAAWISKPTQRSDSFFIDAKRFDGEEWSDRFRIISDSCFSLKRIELAVDNDNRIWMIWEKIYYEDDAYHQIINSCYFENGEWSEVIYVASEDGENRSCSIAVTPQGKAYVSYYNIDEPFWMEVYVREWNEDQHFWEERVLISEDPSLYIFFPYETTICADSSGGLWVAWTDVDITTKPNCGSKGDSIVTKGRYFNGSTWEPQQMISMEAVLGDQTSHPNLALGPDGKMWISYNYMNWQEIYCNLVLHHTENNQWSKDTIVAFHGGENSFYEPELCSDGFRLWMLTTFDFPDNDYDIASRYIKDNVLSDTFNVSQYIDITPVSHVTADSKGNLVNMMGGAHNDSIFGFLINWMYNDTLNVIPESITKNHSIIIYPNPFEKEVCIDLQEIYFPHKSGTIQIFNIQGKLVKTLPINARQVKWDGTDQYSKKVTPGTYFIQVNFQNSSIIKPVVKL